MWYDDYVWYEVFTTTEKKEKKFKKRLIKYLSKFYNKYQAKREADIFIL